MIADQKILTDSAYLRLLKEKAFLQSRDCNGRNRFNLSYN